MTLSISLPTGLFSSTAYPFTITVDSIEVSQSLIDFPSCRIEDVAADDANGSLSLKFWDSDSSRAPRLQSVVQVYDDISDVYTFLGLVQRRNYVPQAVGRWVEIEAVSIGWLLDQILVPLESRPVESDNARAGYLWGKYARSPFSGDFSKVSQTNAAVAADVLANLTLRQALAQTAELAGSTVRFYPDAVGRLHWFAGTESDPGAAPYNINVALAPGGGNVAPDNLTVERDGNIVNRFYVRGANEAGSGYYQDDASVGQYGPREAYLDAPSADTAAKALTIAQLQLGRVAQPNVRGSFSTEEPYNGWRAGQNVTITDARNDLSAYVTRIVKVTSEFTKGDGKRRYHMEFSDTGARLGGVPSFGGGAGIPGQVIGGTVTDSGGNPILTTDPSALGGAFGPAVRRFITSGVENGDFVDPPPSADSEIGAANVLPRWTLTKLSGTAVRATSVADSAAASGRAIQFSMGPGAAGDDTYIEQIIPVIGARGQNFGFFPRATVRTGAAVNAAEVYCTAQYLTSDGLTTTGAAGTFAKTLTSIGASTTFDFESAWPNTTGSVTTDAYFVRVRVGLRRAGAATSDSVSVNLTEVSLAAERAALRCVDIAAPDTFGPLTIWESSGSGYWTIDSTTGTIGLSQTLDVFDRFQVEFDGATGKTALWFGPGSGTQDANLYRDIAGRLKSDHQFHAVQGLATRVVAGAVSDASFSVTPVSGTIAIDTTNSRIYVRVGSTWKSVAVA